MFSSRLLIKPTAVQIDRTKDASPFSIIVLHNVVRNRTLALLIAHSYATPLSYLEPNAAQVSLRTLVQHCCAEISAHRASNAPQDTWASRIPPIFPSLRFISRKWWRFFAHHDWPTHANVPQLSRLRLLRNVESRGGRWDSSRSARRRERWRRIYAISLSLSMLESFADNRSREAR